MPSRIESRSGADILADAVKAAEAVFKAHGFARPAVVVNVAWREPTPYGDSPVTCAMGSRVPSRYRVMLAASLRESAEEAGG